MFFFSFRSVSFRFWNHSISHHQLELRKKIALICINFQLMRFFTIEWNFIWVLITMCAVLCCALLVLLPVCQWQTVVYRYRLIQMVISISLIVSPLLTHRFLESSANLILHTIPINSLGLGVAMRTIFVIRNRALVH